MKKIATLILLLSLVAVSVKPVDFDFDAQDCLRDKVIIPAACSLLGTYLSYEAYKHFAGGNPFPGGHDPNGVPRRVVSNSTTGEYRHLFGSLFTVGAGCSYLLALTFLLGRR